MKLALCFLAIATTFCVDQANAGFFLAAGYRADNAPSFSNDFTTGGQLGTPVLLDLYLVEDNSMGFFAGSAQIALTQSGVNPETPETNLMRGPGFTSFGPAPAAERVAGPPVMLRFNNNFASPQVQSTVDAANNRSYVKLGSFDVLPNQTALFPNNPGGPYAPTVYTWSDYDGANNFFITRNGDNGGANLIASDATLLAASGSFLVSVPEPSSVGLLAVAGLGFCRHPRPPVS